MKQSTAYVALFCVGLAWESWPYASLRGGVVLGLLVMTASVTLACVRRQVAFCVRVLLTFGGAYLGNQLLIAIEGGYAPHVAGVGPLAAFLLRMVGIRAEWDSELLLTSLSTGHMSFRASWAATDARILLVFVCVRLLCATFVERGAPWETRSKLTTLWVALGFYVLLSFRLCWSVLAVASSVNPFEHPATTIMATSHPWLTTVSLAVAAILWELFVSKSERIAGGARELPGAWSLLASCAAASCIAGGLSVACMGVAKPGRIVIDDRLSGVWAPAGRLLNKQNFGDFSTYSFAALAEFLARRFSVAVNRTQMYTSAFLKDVDVLVLKTPQLDLEPGEIDAVRDWVQAGGGLWLIGDHTDLFGMNTRLAPLLAGTGIGFNFNYTECLTAEQTWRSQKWELHPIAQGLRHLPTMTACSLSVDLPAMPCLTLQRCAASPGDYGRRSNFGVLHGEPSEYQGLQTIAATANLGRGRVAVFGDSTVLSSFSFYAGDTPSFVVNTILWLNSASAPAMRVMGWAIATLAIGILVCLAMKFGVSVAALGAVWGLWVGWVACGGYWRQVASAIADSPDTMRVGFVLDGGHAWLPPVIGGRSNVPADADYNTFCQLPLRLGAEVEVVALGDVDRVGACSVLVIINPEECEFESAALYEAFVQATREWARDGGTLVVLERSSQVLHTRALVEKYVRGLNLVAQAEVGDLMAGVARIGKGKVILIGGAERFSTAGLGHCMAMPSRAERRNYAAGFALFEKLCGVRNERRLFEIL